MLTSQRFGAHGQLLAGAGLGDDLGGIWDSISSAVGSVADAVKGVANTACGVASSMGPSGSALATQLINPSAGYTTYQAEQYCNAYNSVVNPPKPAGGGAAAPLPTMPTAPVSKYPVGSMTRFNTTRGLFVIYAPIAAGFGDAFGALGASVTPPPPAGTVAVGVAATAPTGVPQVGTEKDVGFFSASNPWFWATVAGAVVVVGGGSYMIFRRKRA
jgi:hypothetical protein